MAYTEQEIERTLKDYIVKEFMYDKLEITLANDLPLIESGIIDSLGIFTLIGYIESEMKVKIRPDDVVIENFETVDAVTTLVKSRQK